MVACTHALHTCVCMLLATAASRSPLCLSLSTLTFLIALFVRLVCVCVWRQCNRASAARELVALACATTRVTRSAVVAAVVRTTFRSPPALHVATPPLRCADVRHPHTHTHASLTLLSPKHASYPCLLSFLCCCCRQLGCQGQAPTHRWHRPHAPLALSASSLQEQLPQRHPGKAREAQHRVDCWLTHYYARTHGLECESGRCWWRWLCW